MPVWVQIVSLIVGIIGGILGIFGITAYIGERMKHKAALRNQREDAEARALEEMRETQRLNQLRAIIREENADLKADMAEIKHNLALNTKGTVTILRNDMKKSLDYCKNKGSVSSSDVANWNELYNVYGELGGNHFREFVDVWKRELNDIPTEIELEAKKEAKKKATKKRLVEDK